MRLEWRDPRTLEPHKDNYRIHPAGQRRALERGLKTLGWLTPLVMNARTGRLLDGHLRREEAIEKGLPEVPVILVDVSEEHEHAALGIIDTVSAMAVEDDELLAVIAKATADLDGDLARLLYSLEGVAEDEVDTSGPVDDKQGIGMVPGEDINYVVLLFRDSVDWLAAQDHFGIERVQDPFFTKSKKLGPGRVVDGGAYLTRLRSEGR